MERRTISRRNFLNLAVGGHFDGDPRSDSVLPATMLEDYVRVFNLTPK